MSRGNEEQDRLNAKLAMELDRSIGTQQFMELKSLLRVLHGITSVQALEMTDSVGHLIDFLIRGKKIQKDEPNGYKLLIDALKLINEAFLADLVREYQIRIFNAGTKNDQLRLSSYKKTKEMIGKGASGKVFLYQHKDTGKMIAVKEIDVPLSLTDKEYEDIVDEVKMLRELSEDKHPNILQSLFEHTDRNAGMLYIGMEFMIRGSLTKILGKVPLPRDELRRYTHQILSGVKFLHDKHIAHRDIKSDNILLDGNNCIKLADFGISKKLSTYLQTHGAKTAAKGTYQYMSPEAVKGCDDEKEGYGIKTDIWSVGCVVLEMATGKLPWNELAKNPISVIFHVGSGKVPTIPDSLHEDVKNFLAMTFTVNPELRPSADDLLKYWHE